MKFHQLKQGVDDWRKPIPFLANGVGVIGTVITSDHQVILTKRNSHTGVRPGEWDVSVVVVVPMMMPGVLAGAIMSWITILGELSSSIILYSAGTQTLSVSIYTEVIRGNFGNASAYSAILTLTSIVSLLLFFKLTGKALPFNH